MPFITNKREKKTKKKPPIQLGGFILQVKMTIYQA